MEHGVMVPVPNTKRVSNNESKSKSKSKSTSSDSHERLERRSTTVMLAVPFRLAPDVDAPMGAARLAFFQVPRGEEVGDFGQLRVSK
jgi:hypothetical protein